MSFGYIRYFPNGRIKSSGIVSQLGDLNRQNRLGLLLKQVPPDMVNVSEKYVDISGGPGNHVVASRPVMSISIDKVSIQDDGIDKATITGLPVGTVITVNDQSEITVNDGLFEFTTVLPGRTTLRIESFPDLPEEITIFGVA